MLQQLTWGEHRELNDLLSVEPVGGERLDWHFARLMSLVFAVMGKADDDAEPKTLADWLLESMIAPALEPVLDDDEAIVALDAVLHALPGLVDVTSTTEE